MSRPKPTILLTITDKRTYETEQILQAKAIYAVVYEGQPINLRYLQHPLMGEKGAKYKKVSYSNPGHAFNQADRLNALFKTDKFAVVKYTVGEVIER